MPWSIFTDCFCSFSAKFINKFFIMSFYANNNPSCAVAAYMIRTYDATNEVTHTHCPELHISNPAPYQ